MAFRRIVVTPAALLSGVVKLLVLAVVVIVLLPPLRRQAVPHVEPALNPVRRVVAKERVDRISRFMEREMHITGMEPQDRDLPHVLRKLFPGREDIVTDPWGSRFFLRRRSDGFHVSSPGPDRRRGTRDDIHSRPRALPSSRNSLPAH